MADTGLLDPASAVSEGAGLAAWSNASNVTASDNTYATASVAVNGVNSKYLYCYDFGAAVPLGATINGVEVVVHRKCNFAGIQYNAVDQTIQLNTASATLVGSNKAATSTKWPTTEATATYGGSADLWGATLDVATVNSSGFGVSIRCAFTNVDDLELVVASVDYVTMTITYTAAAVVTSLVLEPGSYQPLMRH